MITANHEKAILCAPESEIKRFWSFTLPGKDGCIEWAGCKNCHGYGIFYLYGQQITAHRVAYAISNGEIPKGLVIRHKCHNRACCNPSHLLMGTQQENIQDMVNAGRQFSELKRKPKSRDHALNIAEGVRRYRANLKLNGVAHPCKRKLTEEDVRNIRKLYMNGSHSLDIAKKYAVSQSSIQRIVKGRCYAHVI